MNRRTLCISIFFFALLSAAIVTPQRAMAVQEMPSLAAESCITLGDDGQAGYRFVNACDYAVEVAYCEQSKNDPGLCLRTPNWTRETVNAKSNGAGKMMPEQELNLFACRIPGTVEILASGMARCATPPGSISTTGSMADLPLMPQASLKNPGSIITSIDYPPQLHDKEGTARFDLVVSPDGKPVSCAITSSSGHDILDQRTCNAFVKRARFSPAKDGSGNPTTGRYKGSVTWKAP